MSAPAAPALRRADAIAPGSRTLRDSFLVTRVVGGGWG